MATPTPNLGLIKPDMPDEVDQTIPALAENFGKIDTAITNNSNGLTALKADVVQRAINVKYPPEPFVSLKGDGLTDDTVAYQALIASGRKLFFPQGDYLVSDTLSIIGSFDWEGENWRKTKIKFIGASKTLLNDVDTTSGNYATIKNMRFEGNGTDQNQIAFNLKGYMYELYKVEVSSFTTAGKLGGVYIRVDNSYIHNNVNGLVISPNTGDESGISTMIRLKNVVFTSNSGTSLTNNDGGTYSGFINLEIDSCGFELGGKAFDFAGAYQNLIIHSSWFEGNVEKPTLTKFNLSAFNNFFNGGASQEFNYIGIASGIQPFYTGGISNMTPKGDANFRKYKFQHFDNDNIIDEGQIILEEKDNSGRHYLQLTDSTGVYALQRVNAGTTFLFNEEYHILINGEALTHDLPTMFTPTLTKISTGVYKITFATRMSLPVIQSNCLPTTMSGTKAMYCGLHAGLSIDSATYNTFGVIDTITVTCFDANNANTKTDAKIVISIKPQTQKIV